MEPDTAARLADLLARTNRRLRRASRDELDRTGVTPGQLRVLRTLASADAPLRVGELARRLDVIPRSATSAADLLERAGLVQRLPDPADRRATLVALTPAGRGVLRTIRAERAAGLARLLDRLGEDEQAELIRLLTVLTDDD